MISQLKLSHFAIIPAEVYKPAELPDQNQQADGETGIGIRVIGTQAIVTSVVQNSPGDQLGVQMGWEIIRVDDADIVDRLKRLDRELPDTPSKRVELASRMIDPLDPVIGTTVSVTFLNGKNQEVPLDIPFGKPRGEAAKFGNLGEIRVWIETKTVDANIGYIALSGFFNPTYVMTKFNEAMTSFSNSDGIILDLRGNGGGMGAMAMAMAGWLVPSSKYIGIIRSRDNELKIIFQPRAFTYDGPVAVLVDGHSGSASEFLAGGLQEIGRACIIGSLTKGEVLPGQFITLPNEDIFLCATSDFFFASGKTLEGIGVVPDIEAPHTQQALLEGKDQALEAAISWIRRQ